MVVRIAVANEFPEVMSILEGALLDVQSDAVRAAIQSESVRVYVENDRILGVIVVQPSIDATGDIEEQFEAGIHIEAIAVRPNRRNQGIGRELVEDIVASYGSATVSFEEQAKPFYQSIGVSILTCEDNTYYGVLTRDRC